MIQRTRDRMWSGHALVPAALLLASGFFGGLLMGAHPAAAQVLNVQADTLELAEETCGAGTGDELVIGEKMVDSGIVFIFEGAKKDIVHPKDHHLVEADTHVHIEARVNWAETETDVPPGTPAGGFVPYLNISAKVTNESDTDKVAFVPLPPHINLIDNFHYAYNMQLPGAITDAYTVEFFVAPPGDTLAKHYDWVDGYGASLMNARSFTYTGCDFEDIALGTRPR